MITRRTAIVDGIVIVAHLVVGVDRLLWGFAEGPREVEAIEGFSHRVRVGHTSQCEPVV